jgi:hypothetical protein
MTDNQLSEYISNLGMIPCMTLTIKSGEHHNTIPGDRLFLWFLAAGMPVSVNSILFQVSSETSLSILTVSTVVSHLAETLSLVAGVLTKSNLAVPSQSSHRSRYTR